jgi:hypothetical protein
MSTHQHDVAAATGLVTPTSDNAPWQARVGGIEEGDSADSAELAELRKRLVKLQAELALRGIELQELASGALQAVAPGLLVRFTELAAAEAWSRGRGGCA